MACFKQVKVDVLMVWNLTPLLGLFLFQGLVAESSGGDTLGQELAHSPGANVSEALVGVPDLAQAKGSQACKYG